MQRIEAWILNNNILNEFQAGFRKGYSTIDNIFNLTSIVRLNFNIKNKVYAFFVDFSCAFDLIPRNSLLFKLSILGLSSKYIRILSKLYTNTSSQVWDGKNLSNSFNVNQGVKQGCLLSPILFSLYINDLHECLPDGVNISGVTVKVLLYADDLVILSDSPKKLQDMIHSLNLYCGKWSLNINLNKSKIMVFREYPRISSQLEWFYGNQKIEIVNEYKYLGVILTYNLSFLKHLEERLITAKSAINASWQNYMYNPKISFSNKLKIFNTAAKSIMFYGAQIWGISEYQSVEKLFRFFIKKIFFLPSNTPNYMLHLETGIASQFSETLRLHCGYILKTLCLPDNRLPKFLASEILQKNISWSRKWLHLCSELGIQFNFNSGLENLKKQQKIVVNALIDNQFKLYALQARNSQNHKVYSKLIYYPFVNDSLVPYVISLIFRARGGLLNLNGNSLYNLNKLCDLCNLNEEEDTFHFIAKCPIFNYDRQLHFGKQVLNECEFLDILNGKNYFSLVNYLKSCQKYRNFIITELY